MFCKGHACTTAAALLLPHSTWQVSTRRSASKLQQLLLSHTSPLRRHACLSALLL
jgi:hypothetical protein